MNGEIMSDIDKPTPESTAIPLDSENMETFALAFQHISKKLIAANGPEDGELSYLQATLGTIGMLILSSAPSGHRIARFSELVNDYKTQLGRIGYRAFLDGSILIVETIEARP